MPRNKDLKRLVRARMSKTGESYTASRAKIMARSAADTRATSAVAAAPPAPPRADYAALAGTADATIKAKTGCTWDRWVFALDHYGADRMSHRDIAALVSSKYKIDGWWAQMVTVGYERIRGLRARGQRRDGSYEVGKSRTFNVPLTTLFQAWADARLRGRWLDGTVGKVRTLMPKKSMRLDGQDHTIVVVGFMSKGRSKSVVAVQHTKLRDRDTANRLKQYWSERLDALGDVLTSA
ncbi:MAG: hypothetical protein ACRD15_19380 [Vicinamibacterales bacterium]